MSKGNLGRRGLLLVLGACLSLIAFAGVAQADVVTLGTPFGSEEPPGESRCGPGETCSLAVRAAEAPASGTVAAKDGTVVSYRLSWPIPVAGYHISVVREDAPGLFTVTATSPEVTPVSEEGVEEFDVDLPIKAGELIALTIPEGGSVGQFHGFFRGVAFAGALAFGRPVVFEGEGEGPVEIGYNATIAYQPTATEAITKEVVRTVEAPAKPAPAEAHCVVPKLQGQKLAAAKAKLRAAQCKVGIVSRKGKAKAATAKVVAQSPKPGSALPVGTAISLKLG